MTHPLIGTQAPDFSLPNEVGDVVRLSDFLEQTVVLYFYPKAMTPGCTVQACGIRDSIDQFNAFVSASVAAGSDARSIVGSETASSDSAFSDSSFSPVMGCFTRIQIIMDESSQQS